MTESPAVPLLRYVLAPIAEWLGEPAVEDIAIQRPGEVWVYRHGAWGRHEVPLSLDDLEEIAILAGSLRHQDVGAANPLCSTELPDGQRLQICFPPCVPTGTVALTIRKHDSTVVPIEAAAGRYEMDGWNAYREGRDAREMQELLALYDAGDFFEFMKGCVRARLNIFLTGATGSGKTSLEKTLISTIDPAERLITIEDVPEVEVIQPNHVRLLFRRDDKAEANIDSETLLQACLRQRPDRVFMAEVRGKEAWTYAREAMTGHPGAISTIHGNSAATAFRWFFLLCKDSPGAAGLDKETLAGLLSDVVDVIVPLKEVRGSFNKRHLGSVWFFADAARRGQTAADLLRD